MNGVVFRSMPYSETSFILDIYTRQKGLNSYIISGIRKRGAKSGSSLYKPMSFLNFIAYSGSTDKLFRIKEAKLDLVFNKIPYDVVRSTVAIFMIDLCRQSIREKESNEPLFDFILDQFRTLDNLPKLHSDYHMSFAVALSRFLGFFPRNNFDEENIFFDLENGLFIPSTDGLKHYLSGAESAAMSAMIQNSEDRPKLTKKEREHLLDGLVDYYRLHVDGFQKLPSLEVCRTIFN